MNGSEYDEAAVSAVRDYMEGVWNNSTTPVLRDWERKTDLICEQMLENLAARRALHDGVNLAEISSIGVILRETVSSVNGYHAALLSRCSFGGQNNTFAMPVNAVFERPVQGNHGGGFGFDETVFRRLADMHRIIQTGFGDYYRSGLAAILSEVRGRMVANLDASRDVDNGFDIQELTRFNNYIESQAESYNVMAASVLACFEDSAAAVFTPVSFNGMNEPMARSGTALSPLPVRAIGGSMYNYDALSLVEREIAAYRESFEAFKSESLKKEAGRTIFEPMIGNIRSRKDLGAGISSAAYMQRGAYFAEQTVKAEAVFTTLLNRLGARNTLRADATETQTLASFAEVINVNLPAIELVDQNGFTLDRETARILDEGFETVRAAWRKENIAWKNSLMDKRFSQYRANTKVRRDIDYGITDSEVKDAVNWEIKQQGISRSLFASLVTSCALDQALPENVSFFPAAAVDLSPLPLSARFFDGKFYDSDMVSAWESMAGSLPPVLVEQIRSETEKAVQRQMDILRKNAADYAEYRYRMETTVSLLFANVRETLKDLKARICREEYEKANPELALYMSSMTRDFRLDEELDYELREAVRAANELFAALCRDFTDCALPASGSWDNEGEVSPVNIQKAANAVTDYINDVFPALADTNAKLAFVEHPTIDRGYITAVQVGVGFIPGIGLAAGLAMDAGIEVMACILEGIVKTGEYEAEIAKVIGDEEQELLHIINRPVLGGIK